MSISENEMNLLRETNALRYQILDAITDADLAYRPPGNNLSFAELLSQMTAVERAYIDSFRTFQIDYALMSVPNQDAVSVEHLRTVLQKLDSELEAAIRSVSDEDYQNRPIDRGGWSLPVGAQFHTYREGVLIYCGKASIYLNALGKTPAQQFREWIW